MKHIIKVYEKDARHKKGFRLVCKFYENFATKDDLDKFVTTLWATNRNFTAIKVKKA